MDALPNASPRNGSHPTAYPSSERISVVQVLGEVSDWRIGGQKHQTDQVTEPRGFPQGMVEFRLMSQQDYRC